MCTCTRAPRRRQADVTGNKHVNEEADLPLRANRTEGSSLPSNFPTLRFPAHLFAQALVLSHLSCFPPLISSHHSFNHFIQPTISTLVISSLSLGTHGGSRRSSSPKPVDRLSCQDVRDCVCLSRSFPTFLVGTHSGGHQAHSHVLEMRKPRLKEDKRLARKWGPGDDVGSLAAHTYTHRCSPSARLTRGPACPDPSFSLPCPSRYLQQPSQSLSSEG